MPYLSVIMPVYGVEKYVSQAIESVISQTFQDWELLIVNDGTKDRSREIAHSYEIKDSRIKIIDKENGGLSDARNVGLLHAKGRYVHFFDSDDYINSNYYLDMINSISTNEQQLEPDVLVSGYVVEFQDLQGQVLSKQSRILAAESVEDIVDEKILDFVENFFSYAWNKFFKNDFLKSKQLFYQKGLYSIEDMEFMRRFVGFAPKIKLCVSDGYNYVNRERITLGRCYNRDMVAFNTRKINILRELLSFFLVDKNVVEQIIRKRYIKIFDFLFHSLFFYAHDLKRKKCCEEISYILNCDELYKTIYDAEVQTYRYMILKQLIVKKRVFMIYCFYKTIKLKKKFHSVS